MDIHKPKPWHGLREFLKEYLIIVVGVLTALGLEQVADMLHWRHKIDEAEHGHCQGKREHCLILGQPQRSATDFARLFGLTLGRISPRKRLYSFGLTVPRQAFRAASSARSAAVRSRPAAALNCAFASAFLPSFASASPHFRRSRPQRGVSFAASANFAAAPGASPWISSASPHTSEASANRGFLA